MAFIYANKCCLVCFMPYFSKYMEKRNKNKFCPIAVLKMSLWGESADNTFLAFLGKNGNYDVK